MKVIRRTGVRRGSGRVVSLVNLTIISESMLSFWYGTPVDAKFRSGVGRVEWNITGYVPSHSLMVQL